MDSFIHARNDIIQKEKPNKHCNFKAIMSIKDSLRNLQQLKSDMKSNLQSLKGWNSKRKKKCKATCSDDLKTLKAP